jgi:pimeloyl-ACP methyl ester carboxylesterase
MRQSSLHHRLKEVIDRRSYIFTYHAESTRDFVLFIHGVLGDYEETWKDTPTHLMTESALAEADYGSFGYETTVFDSKTTRVHAQQLVTWMRTHVLRYERIFIVAHSMGGLITREACALLAKSRHADDRDLLGRIKRGFFVAVPIAGSRTARWLVRVPLLARFNRKLRFLAEPRVAGQDLHDLYVEAIGALGPDVPRPKFSHFTGSGDAVVAEPPEWVLTEDDRHEGVVEGTHSSIKSDQTANSTLLRRIVQLIEQHQHAGALVAPSLRAAADQPRDVLVLACSATKASSGDGPHPQGGGLLDALDDAAVRASAAATRAEIRSLLQAGRIEGIEFNEGNRRFRRQNLALVAGPDFGGIAGANGYAPAYKRYMGRSYQATPAEWEQFLALPEAQRPAVLIVSGLYGLCRIEDSIQNYDCHLSDVDIETGQTLQALWKGLLTDLLLSHLTWLERRGHRVGRVFNLLAEDYYRSALDWRRVAAQRTVWTQQFERSQGRDALDNLGVWLRGTILRPSRLGDIEPGTYTEDPLFVRADRVRFNVDPALQRI